jgi:hypothetical protein
MNALSIFDGQPVTKSEQDRWVESAKQEILSGYVDPVTADLHLKALEDVIVKIRKDSDVQEYTIAEAERYGKSFLKNGTKIEVSARTTKDYSGCGDNTYNDMIAQLEALKQQIKAREAMLSTGVNPETGETYAPPQTKTTTFLKYTFAK